MQRPRVLLVSPPWTSLNEPSLGLSLLSAVLDREGIPCRVLHLNLFTLSFLRADTYASLARVYALNDFVFSGVLDPTVTPPQVRLLREKCAELAALGAIDYRKHGGIPGLVEQILHLRAEVVPDWIEQQVHRMLTYKSSLIGFTCMFDQTISSLAIASRVKALAPGTLIALGGYAVRSPTGEMLLDSCPWIDAVCTGEGEPCIAELARSSTEQKPDLSRVPNLLFRDELGTIVASPRAASVDMDTVPVPNFDDFYADVRHLRDEAEVEIAIDRLPIENSRGCWWGAVHHCTFCGIHDDDLVYRSKSVASVLHSLEELSARYGCHEFRFSDYILPYQYYSTLLPELVERGSPYRLKCELKANITSEQLRLLAEAGFVEIQPGVESFCTSVLQSMDKGVSATQNVYLLLLGRRYGIAILYNLLYGLPDDDPIAFEAMVRALPRLLHLDPPSTRGRIQITRFAPLQTIPGRFGIAPASHERSYELIFSKEFLERSRFDLDRYCYIYELPFEPAPRLAKSYREIDRLCDLWVTIDRERQVDLLFTVETEGQLQVKDTRVEPARTYSLNEDDSSVILAAQQPCTRMALARSLTRLTSERLAESLSRLHLLGLLFEDGGKLVSLALPREITSRRHWWDNYRTRWQMLPQDEVTTKPDGAV